MIRRFTVTDLNERMTFDLSLHDDLNIITGKNGSGKTTLLKLMWSMLSGSIERILPEINFQTATLETDRFSLAVTQVRDEGPKRITWEFTGKDGNPVKGHSAPNSDRGGSNRLIRHLARVSGSSLFFPTFRRIEGGFAMSRQSRVHGDANFIYYDTPFNIEQALSGVSQFLTVSRHRFIASISTNDIVSMLTNQYANLSEQLNEDHRRLSTDIDTLIRTHERQVLDDATEASRVALAQTTLDAVRDQMRRHSEHQEALLQPFTALSGLISRIFRHRGIQVTSRITLGETAEAIASDKLSAGEKQMLSFLAYNAFESNSVVFIDEPEISLHVDWQRQLFPTLLSQGTTNQFIVATHSPFIYASYSDKELLLDTDRGE